jgi:hypothetical protein
MSVLKTVIFLDTKPLTKEPAVASSSGKEDGRGLEMGERRERGERGSAS